MSKEAIEERKNIEPRLSDDIPNDWLKKAATEIKAKYRSVIFPEFKGEKDVEIRVYHPTPGEETICSNVYTKCFDKLIKDPDILTKKEISKILETRGVYGKEQDEIIENLREEMGDIEFTVAKMKKSGKYNKTVMSRHREAWKSKREEINRLFAEKNTYLSNTVEGHAEEEEVKCKLSLCVKKTDGTRVWESLEDLNNESEKFIVIRLLNESMLFWSGLTQEIIDELPIKLLFGGEESENLQEK